MSKCQTEGGETAAPGLVLCIRLGWREGSCAFALSAQHLMT